jgi:sortase A
MAGRRAAAKRWLLVIRALLVACVLAGVSLVAYTGYQVWDPLAGHRQHQEAGRLIHEWQQPAVRRPTGKLHLVTGKPFAFIQVPAFGPHWRFTIVEGTSLAQLSTGPGHVTGTQRPGQRGNFAVAAHDITAGNPFLHLKRLRRGDAVIITTRYAVYRYLVKYQKVVRYTDSAVLDPVPGRPGKRPHKRLITLITCTPATLAFTPYRVVVTGTLASSTVRDVAVTTPAAGRSPPSPAGPVPAG